MSGESTFRHFEARQGCPGAHTFPDALDEDEKRAVLEYLKTL